MRIAISSHHCQLYYLLCFLVMCSFWKRSQLPRCGLCWNFRRSAGLALVLTVVLARTANTQLLTSIVLITTLAGIYVCHTKVRQFCEYTNNFWDAFGAMMRPPNQRSMWLMIFLLVLNRMLPPLMAHQLGQLVEGISNNASRGICTLSSLRMGY